MYNHYLVCLKFSATEKANVMIDILRKLPFFKNKIKDSYTSEEKKKFKIMAMIFSYLYGIVKTFLYVLFFMYIPMRIFSSTMKAGNAGFSIENCFVYFSLVLSCVAGSILHSNLFDVNESSYVKLKIMKVNPSIYFRSRYFSRGICEFFGFMLAFCIFGMNPFKAFYLVIVILISRYIGEAFNILIFRVTGKRFADIKSAPVVVMLLSLFMAYFVVYLRGYVPAAYSMIFETLWFYVILIIGGLFTYYVWINDNFDKIISRVYNVQNYIEKDEEEPEDWVEDDRKDGRKTGNNLHSGNIFLTDMFFKRNRKMFVHETIVKLIVIAVIFILALGTYNMGNGDVVKTVISYSLPVLIFVVFSLCESSRYCRELYRQCDRFVIRFNLNSEKVTDGFLFTLLQLLKVNLIPVCTLAGSYIIMGLILSDSTVMKTILHICLGIILLGILCTIINLLLYYLIQPYDSEGNNVRKKYFVTYAVLYIICYACLFIRTDSLNILLGICVATALVTALSVTLVYRIGKKTFRIKK